MCRKSYEIQKASGVHVPQRSMLRRCARLPPINSRDCLVVLLGCRRHPKNGFCSPLGLKLKHSVRHTPKKHQKLGKFLLLKSKAFRFGLMPLSRKATHHPKLFSARCLERRDKPRLACKKRILQVSALSLRETMSVPRAARWIKLSLVLLALMAEVD